MPPTLPNQESALRTFAPQPGHALPWILCGLVALELVFPTRALADACTGAIPTFGCKVNGLITVCSGTAGDDSIFGTGRADVILGGGGNDEIVGKGGDDLLCGGSGDDVIRAGGGSDVVEAGSGNDRVLGQGADDWIGGGDGDDILEGGFGDDVIDAGDGNDSALGQSGHDEIDGGAGEDVLNGGGGHDWLVGGSGFDSIDGRMGNDACGDRFDAIQNCESSAPGATASGPPPGPVPEGDIVPPPGSLSLPGSYRSLWREPVSVDASSWPRIDVTDPTQMAAHAGCEALDPRDRSQESDHSGFTCAADALAPGECLYFPAGTYNLGRYNPLSGDKCFLGEGPGRTIIELPNGADTYGNTTCFGGNIWAFCPNAFPTQIGRVTGGNFAGRITVTLSSAAGLSAGDWIRLESDYPAGVEESFQGIREVSWGQFARVIAISGRQVTFDEPLREKLGPNPVVKKVQALGPVIVESLSLRYASSVGGPTNEMLATRYVEHLQIRDVEFGESWAGVASLSYLGAYIEGNVFGDQRKNVQYNKAVLNLIFNAQRGVIENNRFETPEVAIELQMGAALNVVGYNLIEPPNTTIVGLGLVRCDRGIFLHGNATRWNLIEGNDSSCTIQHDQFWGQSRYSLLYANRVFAPNESILTGISVEDVSSSNRTSIAPFTAYVLNSTDELRSAGAEPPRGIDLESPGAWIEKNLVASRLVSGEEPSATVRDNAVGVDSMNCSGESLPSSFYWSRVPPWWTSGTCSFLKGEGQGIGACGDDLSAPLCQLPAANL